MALTPQQKRILQDLADGLTTDNIATRHYICASTVKTHIKAIFLELRVHNRIHAVATALRRGLID